MPFNLGPGELMLFGVIAVLLFGSKLPSAMRSLGKGVMEFQKGMTDMKREFHSAMHDDPKATPRISHTPHEYDEPTAPKFEPPQREPQPVSAEGQS
jgi:sec-independent protein translocase protein TatA